MECGVAGQLDCGPRLSEVRSYWNGSARLLQLSDHADQRGNLLALDFPDLPFEPRRSFVVHGAPRGTVRGGHAHKHGSQLLICLSGAVVVEMRFDGDVQRVELSTRTRALLLGAGVWAQQHYSGPNAILLVMASHPYDADSYLPESP